MRRELQKTMKKSDTVKSDLKEKLKQAAFELGFSHIGFARAEPLPDAPLLEWLTKGYHGTMNYMARDPQVRLDPQKLLEGCKTVICTAMNYYTPYPSKSHENHGRISRYAWGRDYHKVVRGRLKKLSCFIRETVPDAKIKICSDSTPISEKAWAQKSGIGWQGKHTILITRDLGSWIFLGEILTDVALDPDPPHPDFCGTCNRCIEACPTQAIPQPYVVDATKCIAYLTIESKEPPPPSLAEHVGDWIFGCDICQEVCPWNKSPQTTEVSDFFPRTENQKPLPDWEKMTEKEFLREFAGTPLMRAKHRHMTENAAVANGNLQQEKNETDKKAL